MTSKVEACAQPKLESILSGNASLFCSPGDDEAGDRNPGLCQTCNQPPIRLQQHTMTRPSISTYRSTVRTRQIIDCDGDRA
jgi:hypothetical protein